MSFSIKRIVLTTDLSDVSWRAWGPAVTLANRWGAELIVLHVCAPSKRPEVNLQIAKKKIENRALTMGGARPDRPIEIVVETSSRVVSELLVSIRRLKADLVVTATHGWSGLSQVLIGSKAEALVRRSPVPVLTIRSLSLPDDLDVDAQRWRASQAIGPLDGR